MYDRNKSKTQLIQELAAARQQIAQLEAARSELKSVENALREGSVDLKRVHQRVRVLNALLRLSMEGISLDERLERALGDIGEPQMIRLHVGTGKSQTEWSVPLSAWLWRFKRGILFVNRCTACTVDLPELMLFRDGKTMAILVKGAEWHDSFVDCTHHLIGVLGDGGQPILAGTTGKVVHQLTLAAQISAREGREVRPNEVH